VGFGIQWELMPTLYIVGTPIGNLEDITLRALRILKEVEVVLCEDTRVTKRLLARYEISTPVMAYHAHSTSAQHKKILDLLAGGKSLALVTDAGTPGISDPGSKLVELVYQEFDGAVPIVGVPGPSALTTALSVSGLPSSEFLFLGFLPHKKGRDKYVTTALASPCTVVLYESPHRIEKLLTALIDRAPERTIVVARELTKIHEEVKRGTPGELLALLVSEPEKRRGEFVVMITPQ